MKPILVLFVVLGAICTFVAATSDANPDIIYLCDVHSPKFGCDPQFWPSGNRLKCMNTTQVMGWASKPVRSDCYSVVAGDDENNGVTTYTPGELLMIHVRVKCYNMLFRGILIYAVDATETKVGDWEITLSEPTDFRRPWQDPSNPCFGSLMHSSAEYKPYHSVLYFKTPAAGTGQITFRAMVKYGNANTGAFYWPMQSDLSLSEKPVDTSSPVTIYKTAAVGQSCTDLCKQTAGYTCDEDAIKKLEDPNLFGTELLGENVCVLPLLSGCGSQSATYDPSTEYCYLPDSTCEAQSRAAAVTSCDSTTPGAARFCACSDESRKSSATSLRAASTLVLLGLFFTNPRAAMFMLVCLGMSSAHNWINSLSRSNGASTYTPFKPAVTDMPRAQVGAGQSFEIEWMTAHGGFTYFAIVHSKNQDNMKLHNQALFEDYIKNAPAGSVINATSGKWMKLHRKDTPTLDNDFAPTATVVTMPNFFEREINKTDPLWISRQAVFEGRVGNIGNPTDASAIYLMQYKPPEIAQDVRVSYQSAKYPWLEAVYRFKMAALQAVRPDVAHFWIPGYAGYGRYLVQFVWSGYRDVIDVDYMPYTVTNIYGTPTNSTRWRRIDHCIFNNPLAVFDVSEVVTDPSYCLRKCASRSSTSCWGVNVVPLKAPSSAYTFTQPPNAVWFYPNIYGTDIYVPWNYTIFNTSKAQLLANPSSDKYMCYTVMPADFTDTTDEYTVSKDPEDPVFYSTCYYRYRGNTFPGYVDSVTPSVTPGTWRYNNKCLSCQSQADSQDGTAVPKWQVADKCINCDIEPSNPVTPVLPQGTVVEKGVRCDGLGGSWSKLNHHNCSTNTSCVIQLIPVGRPSTESLTLSECYAVAKRNPQCSNVFMWSFNATKNTCYCYTNLACCSTCSRRADPATAVYEMASSPDPTCATGVLSTDGASCCSASCGAGKCTASAAVATPNGFCCSTCITRPCSQYGPPCTM